MPITLLIITLCAAVGVVFVLLRNRQRLALRQNEQVKRARMLARHSGSNSSNSSPSLPLLRPLLAVPNDRDVHSSRHSAEDTLPSRVHVAPTTRNAFVRSTRNIPNAVNQIVQTRERARGRDVTNGGSEGQGEGEERDTNTNVKKRDRVRGGYGRNFEIESLEQAMAPLSKAPPRAQKMFILQIDSSQRDYLKFPNPNLYYVQFPVLLRNVIAVELYQATIPRSEYTVNDSNRTLVVQLEGTTDLESVSVQLTKGYYLVGAQLQVELQAQLDAAFPPAGTFSVTYDGSAGTLAFTKALAPQFRFRFGCVRRVAKTLTSTLLPPPAGCPPFPPPVTSVDTVFVDENNEPAGTPANGILLGFPPFNTAYALSLTSPNIIDLFGSQYVDLVADEVRPYYMDSGIVSRIQLLPAVDLTIAKNTTPVPRFFWPVGRMPGLTLRFQTSYGLQGCAPRLYDFNGRQNTVTLAIFANEYKNVLEDEVVIEPST